MQLSFLIRKSWDQRPFAGFPKLFAGYRVLRRLSMPRHPPCTLNSLTTVTDHRHASLGMTTRRTHGRQRIRSFSTLRDSPRSPVLPLTRAIPLAKKVLDDSPAKTEKTLPPR